VFFQQMFAGHPVIGVGPQSRALENRDHAPYQADWNSLSSTEATVSAAG
jgi:hypothetical protein